jgi:hypothetical protein
MREDDGGKPAAADPSGTGPAAASRGAPAPCEREIHWDRAREFVRRRPALPPPARVVRLVPAPARATWRDRALLAWASVASAAAVLLLLVDLRPPGPVLGIKPLDVPDASLVTLSLLDARGDTLYAMRYRQWELRPSRLLLIDREDATLAPGLYALVLASGFARAGDAIERISRYRFELRER